MSRSVAARAAARVGLALVAGFRALCVAVLSVAGAAALAAAPVLLVSTMVRGQSPAESGHHVHLLLGLLLGVVPCVVWGLSWATGGGARAAGAALLLPGVPVVAMTTIFGGGPPGGSRWALWQALPLLPLGLLGARWVAAETRRLVGRWSGVAVARPYRPGPAEPIGRRRALRRLVTGWLLDPQTWRDTAWVLLSGGAVLALVSAYVTAPRLLNMFGPNGEFAHVAVLYVLAFWLAVPVGLWAAPHLLALHDRAARALLGPTRQAELARQVGHLARTRADTIDSAAAQLRRIERDLHDGPQARLVAVGMTLNTAEQLFDRSPEAARALLVEAKESSARTLAELRDLVRGIHPPVLADRGLVDAVRALALDMPLPVDCSGGLPGRPAGPVESAAYFAVSELLANVAKHAGAARVWIDIGHTDGALRIGVTDDGRGGADPARGSGLRGLERRLATFDGVLAISSPPGGPTTANLEIPCALSSPKTSSC